MFHPRFTQANNELVSIFVQANQKWEKMLMLDSTSQQIPLKDGRKLGYAEYGSYIGSPIFFFHGFLGSRFSGRSLDEAAKLINARIISIDRPGIGLSDFKPGRRYSDWPDDVTELADKLAIDRFAILGVSAGGPHALACAFKIPQRLTAAAIVSSPCPYNVKSVINDMPRSERLRAIVGRKAPWLVSVYLSMTTRNAVRDPAATILRTLGELPESDKEILNRPETLQRIADDLRESFLSGTRGVAWEYSLLTRLWGFRLEDISTEIQLWHGEADMTISPIMGHHLANTIPNCRAKFFPGEGHSVIGAHTQEILYNLIV
jgi:pimeloyl-ACP methyl ester carboxylesterase